MRGGYGDSIHGINPWYLDGERGGLRADRLDGNAGSRNHGVNPWYQQWHVGKCGFARLLQCEPVT